MRFIKNFRLLLLLLFTVILFLLISQQALAQDSILPACVESGNCTLCDIIQTAVNAGKVVLGIIGSLVLLMFVYGGFMMLISGGKPEQIQKGKNILINSVIGLAIIFSSYLVVITVVSVVTGQAWTMATLQGKLTCAPISFEPQDLGGYANISGAVPNASTAVPGDQPTIPNNSVDEGGDCNSSPQCKQSLGLICRPKTDACTTKPSAMGTCVKKYQTSAPCGTGCAKNISNDDQCVSGYCKVSINQSTSSFIKGTCAMGSGETCTFHADCTNSEYCDNTGHCKTRVAPGTICNAGNVFNRQLPSRQCQDGYFCYTCNEEGAFCNDTTGSCVTKKDIGWYCFSAQLLPAERNYTNIICKNDCAANNDPMNALVGWCCNTATTPWSCGQKNNP